MDMKCNRGVQVDMKCKYCGGELKKTTVRNGARYDCSTNGCPVIFARVPLYGKTEWVLESRPKIGVVAR